MDSRIPELITDLERGYLTRRGFVAKAVERGLSAAGALALFGTLGTTSAGAQTAAPVSQVPARAVQPKGWQQGRGWGWVWGPNDELGNLNELGPELTMKALRMVRRGKVYDLGLTYDRRSYKWPGHSPGEIITFRSQQGEILQKDLAFLADWQGGNTSHSSFASSALFISDNVSTQIDGFAHFSVGEDPHYYNGYKAAEVVGDWGVMKMGAETIPPIVAPATVIDVPGHLGMDALPAHFAIGPDLLQETLRAQGVDIDVLDIVLIRTGTGGVWLKGEGVGANQTEVAGPDSAGITVAAAKWLVEQKGALAIGTDTSGIEVGPPVDYTPEGTSFNPVHVYLLPTQGVHILEFHNLEDLAADRAYKVAYFLGVNKIKGTTAGTVLRPIGVA
jgi:kynurenine formamidase